MNKEEKISVIIPVYNVEKYVKKCLDSVINQTYKNLEIIIIDDGSTDCSGEIIDSYAGDERCIIIHQENQGLPSVRNVGLSLATGEFISFIDSDDYVDLTMLQEMLNTMKEQSCDICVCNYVMNIQSVLKNNIDFKEGLRNRQQAMVELLEDNTFRSFMCNKLYRREVLSDITFIPQKRMEDFLQQPAIFEKATSVYVMNKGLYFYNVGNMDSVSNNLNTKMLYDICYANRTRYEEYSTKYAEVVSHLFFNRVITAYRFWMDAKQSELQEDMKKEYDDTKKFIQKNIPKIMSNREIGWKLKLECVCVRIMPKLFKKIRDLAQN